MGIQRNARRRRPRTPTQSHLLPSIARSTRHQHTNTPTPTNQTTMVRFSSLGAATALLLIVAATPARAGIGFSTSSLEDAGEGMLKGIFPSSKIPTTAEMTGAFHKQVAATTKGLDELPHNLATALTGGNRRLLIGASDFGLGSSNLETLAKGGISSLTQMLGNDTVMPSQTPQELAEANVAEATKGLADFPQNVVDGVANPPAADSRKLLQLDGLTNELGQLLQAGLNPACNGIQQRFTVAGSYDCNSLAVQPGTGARKLLSSYPGMQWAKKFYPSPN